MSVSLGLECGDGDTAAPPGQVAAAARLIVCSYPPRPSPALVWSSQVWSSLVKSGLAGKLAARRQRHTRGVEVDLVHVARAEDALG